jgi:Tfp pilus assembly protein PilV
MKLKIHQNISGFSLLEVFISAGIFLILIQGTLSIIEQSSNQFKKSSFNFQTAAMLDYWNSEQVNLLLSQEMQS